MNEVRSLNAELLGQSKHSTFGDLKRGQYGENVKSQRGARRGWEGKQEARSGSQSGMIAGRTLHIMVYINGTPGAQLNCEWRPLGCVMQPTWDRGWRRGKSTGLLPDPRKWGREIFVAREISSGYWGHLFHTHHCLPLTHLSILNAHIISNCYCQETSTHVIYFSTYRSIYVCHPVFRTTRCQVSRCNEFSKVTN